MEKHLYVVLSRSNTLMGALIRKVTRYEYNHVSLSLSDDLQPLYSFARYQVNSPLVGGFVEESWLRYLYTKKDVSIKVFKISMNHEQYLHTRRKLAQFIKNKHRYRYDTFGVLSHRMFKKHGPKYKYTCLSFAKRILYEGNLLTEKEKIRSIKELNTYLEPFFYKDMTIWACDQKKYRWGNDQYYKKDSYYKVFFKTMRHFIEMTIVP